jgi:nucleotide-binding universal stress UspA family protein
VLVPIDGSETSSRALGSLIGQIAQYKDGLDIQLLNVQHALPSNVAAHVAGDAIPEYHREVGLEELKAARDLLATAKVPYEHHIAVGEPAEVIARFAAERNCDQIAMGTRGRGSVSNLVLGSVANKVIQLSPVPVLLVK